MIVMDYKDAGAYAVIIFAVVAIITLIPVFWIGDIGIYIVSQLFNNPPRIVYIATWVLLCGGYYFYVLERYLANVVLKNYDRSLQIVAFYVQGLFFSYILSLYGIAKWSLLPLKLIDYFIGGIFRWLLG